MTLSIIQTLLLHLLRRRAESVQARQARLRTDLPLKILVARHLLGEIEFFIGDLLVRIHLIIETIWWTALAPWEFEFSVPGSLMVTFLCLGTILKLPCCVRGTDLSTVK